MRKISCKTLKYNAKTSLSFFWAELGPVSLPRHVFFNYSKNYTNNFHFIFSGFACNLFLHNFKRLHVQTIVWVQIPDWVKRPRNKRLKPYLHVA